MPLRMRPGSKPSESSTSLRARNRLACSAPKAGPKRLEPVIFQLSSPGPRAPRRYVGEISVEQRWIPPLSQAACRTYSACRARLEATPNHCRRTRSKRLSVRGNWVNRKSFEADTDRRCERRQTFVVRPRSSADNRGMMRGWRDGVRCFTRVIQTDVARVTARQNASQDSLPRSQLSPTVEKPWERQRICG